MDDLLHKACNERLKCHELEWLAHFNSISHDLREAQRKRNEALAAAEHIGEDRDEVRRELEKSRAYAADLIAQWNEQAAELARLRRIKAAAKDALADHLARLATWPSQEGQTRRVQVFTALDRALRGEEEPKP